MYLQDAFEQRLYGKEKRALAAWVLIILALGTLPFSNFVGHSHWEYIKWVPTFEDLQSPKYLADILIDIAANTAVYFPVGYLIAMAWRDASRTYQVAMAACIGGGLSLGVEFYQVYCHSRFPSIFDVLTNLTGAILGVRAVFPGHKRDPLSLSPNLTPTPRDHIPAP